MKHCQQKAGRTDYSINDVGFSEHLGKNVDSPPSIKINSRQNEELHLSRVFRAGAGGAQCKSDYLANVSFSGPSLVQQTGQK